MKNFPRFWYDSNAVWGWVENTSDLRVKMKYVMDGGGLKTKEEFLDKSFQHENEGDNFGTRREHTGKKSLREFLKEAGINF